MIGLCFYLEQQGATDSAPGPNLTEWLALKAEFGCELFSIHWKPTVENSHTTQVAQYPSILHVYWAKQVATHVFLKEGVETALADLPAPAGDVIYYIGRNSHAFRRDLEDFKGLTWASLPGGNLWAHEAARVLLES